jgi:hypothetical protein
VVIEVGLKRLLGLTGLFLFVWLFLVVGGFIAVKLLFTFHPNPGFEAFLIAVIRVAVGVVMAGLWLFLWRRLAHAYFRWAVKKRGIQIQ